MDILTWILSNGYTDSVVNSVTSGVKNVQVDNDNKTLTFTFNDDTTQAMQFNQPTNGVDGLSITDIKLNGNNHLIFTMSDGNKVDAGAIEILVNGGLTDEQLTLLYSVQNKVDKDGNKVLSDVNFSAEDKNKLDNLENFDKDYNSLINKPQIPSIVGLATETYVNNKIADVNINDIDLSEYEKTINVDSKLANKSELNHTHTIDNITGLIDEFTNYYRKAETLSKEEINTLINSIAKGMEYKDSVDTVEDLPLVDNNKGDTRKTISNNHINIWDGEKWIDLGNSSIDNLATSSLDGLMSKDDKAKLDNIIIDNLVTLSQLNTALANKSDINHTHSNYVEKEAGKSLVSDVNIAKIDALATKVIPTKTSELNNDSSFITKTDMDSSLSNYQTDTQVNTKLNSYAKLTDLANKLEVGNVKAGKNITLDVVGNDVTINSKSGSGSGIDDDNVSEETTYSSSKIVALDEVVKTDILNTLQDDYMDKSTYDIDKDGIVDKTNIAKKIEGIEESPLFSVYGKSPSGVEGFYEFPIGKIDENTNKFQSVRQNAIANEVYTVELINENKLNDLIVQCYEFKQGEQDVVTTLREFNNTDKNNFYYNEDNIDFDNGMKIKNNYEISSTLNSTSGFYESEVINKDNYLEMLGMGVK